MKKYERVKALVSLDAIAHNFEEMHKNVKEGTKIIAVIKADGYGHGARAIARLIQDYDYIWGFAALPRLPQKKRWNFDMQESPSLS